MQTRRQFLTATAGLTAVSLAGCSGIGGGGTETGRYTDLVAETETRPLRINIQKVDEIISAMGPGSLFGEELMIGVSPSDVEYSVSVTNGGPFFGDPGGYVVMIGPFEFDALESKLEAEEESFERRDEVNGFQTIQVEQGNNPFYLGVDEMLVYAESRDSYQTATEIASGSGSTIFGDNDNPDSLANVIHDPAIGVFNLGSEGVQIDPTGTAVAGAYGIEIGDTESDVTSVALYETADEASENQAAVEKRARETYTQLENIESEIDGRQVIVTGTMATTEM